MVLCTVVYSFTNNFTSDRGLIMRKIYNVTATSNKGEIKFYVYGIDFAEACLNGLAFNSYNTEIYSILNIELIDLDDPKNKVVNF